MERGQLGSYWLEHAILTSVAFTASVVYVVSCVASDGNAA